MQLPKYLPEVDGIRAIAVLLVLVNHLNPELLTGGFTGVDIFFTISGYVVSKSLTRSAQGKLSSQLQTFYARRILRILPALLGCLLVTMAASIAFIPRAWISEAIPITGLAAVFGGANMAMILTDDGYFAPRAEYNPFTNAWSLGVEEQFYLLFPILFFGWLQQNRGGSKQPLQYGKPINAIAVLSVASLILAAALTTASPNWAYYSLPSRFWQLGVGVLLFQWHNNHGAAGQHQRAPLITAGVAMMALAAIVCRPTHSPYPDGLLPVLGTALVLHGCGGGPASGVAELLRSTPAQWLGNRSYSLYLWHWPVIVLLRWTLGLQGIDSLLAVGLSFGLAMLSYQVIEQPFRSLAKNNRVRPQQILVVGLAASSATFGLGLQGYANQKHLSLSITRDENAWVSKRTTRQPINQVQNHKSPSGTTLFVVGNSHAPAYWTMLEAVAKEQDINIVVDNLRLCAPGKLDHAVLKRKPNCSREQDQWLNKLSELGKPGDIVLLASLRIPRFSDQWELPQSVAQLQRQQSSNQAIEQRKQGQAETLALIKRLETMGFVVIIDLPKPIFASPPFRCSDWFNYTNPICAAGFMVSKSDLEAIRQPVVAQVMTLKEAMPSLVVWDPLPELCPGKVCNAFDHQQPLFHDGDHLSGHGNRVLTPAFTRVLQQLKRNNMQSRPGPHRDA